MNAPATADADHVLLLCIDLQPVLLKALPDGAQALRRCCFAVEAAQGLGLPVLFTEQVPAKLGPAASELLARAPTPTVLAKDEFSALANPRIEAAIRASGAKHLWLCGIETPVCIYQTACDALAGGWSVTLLTDGMAARRANDAAAASRHLEKLGANLLPAETVLYARLRSARHPFFRAFTQLVKQYA